MTFLIINRESKRSRLLSAKNDDPRRFGMGLLHRSVFSTRHDVVPVA